jgi:hypothetical protein
VLRRNIPKGKFNVVKRDDSTFFFRDGAPGMAGGSASPYHVSPIHRKMTGNQQCPSSIRYRTIMRHNALAIAPPLPL